MTAPFGRLHARLTSASLALLGGLLLPPAAGAQLTPTVAPAPSPFTTSSLAPASVLATWDSSASAGPPAARPPVVLPDLSATVAGVHSTQSAAAAPTAMQASSGLQHSQVLMIVGGAAVLLGLLTDGGASDVLVVSGAAVGLFGLYLYLH